MSHSLDGRDQPGNVYYDTNAPTMIGLIFLIAAIIVVIVVLVSVYASLRG